MLSRRSRRLAFQDRSSVTKQEIPGNEKVQTRYGVAYSLSNELSALKTHHKRQEENNLLRTGHFESSYSSMSYIYSVRLLLTRARLIIRQNVRKISDISRFVRVHIYKSDCLQMKWARGQRKEFDFGRVASSWKEGSNKNVSLQE